MTSFAVIVAIVYAPDCRCPLDLYCGLQPMASGHADQKVSLSPGRHCNVLRVDSPCGAVEARSTVAHGRPRAFAQVAYTSKKLTVLQSQVGLYAVLSLADC